MSSDAHARVSRAADACMVTASPLQSEALLQRRQCEHQPDRGTVRDCHNVPAGFLPPGLPINQFDVSGIHFGMTRGTSDCMRSALDSKPQHSRLGEARLHLGSDGGIERGEISSVRPRVCRGNFHRRQFAGIGCFNRPAVGGQSKVLPSERSGSRPATPHSNQGWRSSIWMNLCPTTPVAPRIPMGILLLIFCWS